MKTKRIATLFLAMVIALSVIPTAALAAEVPPTEPSFEVAFSLPMFDDETTLVFSEKPVKAYWGIDYFYSVALSFPVGTKVSGLDETGSLIEIYGSGETGIASDQFKDRIYFYETDDYVNYELTISEELSIDPAGVRIAGGPMGRGFLPVMVEGLTATTLDPSHVIYAWQFDPTVPVPDGIDIFPEDIIQTYLQPVENKIQSDDPDIIALAEKITAGKTSDLDRAEAINRWVAGNIWYDVAEGNVRANRGDANDLQDASYVLEHKVGVCVGYSNLTVALLRAIGIPAYIDWNKNHDWPVAIIDNRLVPMDPTWDSRNEYRNGRFGPQRKPKDTWFDAEPEKFVRKHPSDNLDLVTDNDLAATEYVPATEIEPAA